MRRQAEQHLAPVGFAALPPNQPVSFQTIRQLNSAVMSDLKPLGQNTHGRVSACWKSLDCQQGLVLVWFDPRFARSLLAEVQKAPDFITEIGERRVIDLLWMVE